MKYTKRKPKVTNPDRVVGNLNEVLNAVNENKNNLNDIPIDQLRKLLRDSIKIFTDKFPNGFTSWYETHHEVVMFLASVMGMEDAYDIPTGEVIKTHEQAGTGGLYELAEDWTDEFEKQYKGVEWSGGEIDYFETIEKWLKRRNEDGVAIVIVSLEKAKEFIREVDNYVGTGGFHPDTPFTDYEKRGETLYNAANAAAHDKAMEDVWDLFEAAGEDVYEYALSLL